MTIRKNPGHPDQCKPDRKFVAKPGSTVTFQFPEEPTAEIHFDGASPFAVQEFTVGSQTVRADASVGEYQYHVTWGNYSGSGNGTGEIIP